jgi:peptide/nickel transport system ATP-binding protein
VENTNVLSVRDLSVSFGKGENHFHAVKNISFDLAKGETLGIVGESGSGKSVTSLSIMQLTPKPPICTMSGMVRLRRKSGPVIDVLKTNDSELQSIRGNDIAMIFQEPMTSLNPVFTCGWQVAEALRLHKGLSKKEARDRTIELFKKVKLPRPETLFDAYPHQLSGGQKQRVMIAMAISCDPMVLIADEPTTALDVSVQAAILDLLKELQQETGMAMLFITHDLGIISRIANNVQVMYKGSIVESGPASQIFSNPEHAYTKGLLACRPSKNADLVRLPVISDFMRFNADGSTTETHLTAKDLELQLHKDESKEKARKSELYQQQPLLRVRDLTIAYRKQKGWFKPTVSEFRAVDNVSFDVYPGETLGLVGESGCGKTTLGRTILRLIQATSGTVHYGDTDILALEDKKLRAFRKEMQLVFQDPYSSLNPRLTVGTAIMEPMIVHGLHGNDKERKAKAIELLQQVGLEEHHFYRYPHQFSGGQRQRVCIARALSLSPKFLICDESVSALDVSVQAQVLNLLNDLKREHGLTYIFISHDLSVVRFMSDRMMVMKEGKIEELGDADEVYMHPKSEYTKRLIKAIPH